MSTATAPENDKQFVLETVNRFPESASLEEISEELAILASLRRADAEYEAGLVIPHEEVMRRLDQWISR